MDNPYLDQKIEEILMVINNFPEVDKRKKIIRLIAESIWLAGEIKGVLQEAIEVIK